MKVTTAKQIVEYVTKAYKEKWGYVWSLNGELYTQAMADKFKANKRSTNKWRDPATYWTEDCKKWIGKMAADCSGLIVGAIRSISPQYGDRSANTFKGQFTQSGKVETIPDVPGLAVWRDGHIGIYIGAGEVIEARGTEYGVVKTKLSQRDFTHWGYIKDVDYGETQADTQASLQRGDKGEAVKHVQELLIAVGYPLPKYGADGDFGAETETAVKAFQFEWGLAVNGVVSEITLRALEDAAKPEAVTETVTDIELAPEVTEYHAVTTGDVRLRTGPGEEFDKIVTMPKGKRLIALPEKNGWCEACLWLDGKWTQGYVSEKYVRAV